MAVKVHIRMQQKRVPARTHTHTQPRKLVYYSIAAYSGALTITCFDKHKFQFVALFEALSSRPGLSVRVCKWVPACWCYYVLLCVCVRVGKAVQFHLAFNSYQYLVFSLIFSGLFPFFILHNTESTRKVFVSQFPPYFRISVAHLVKITIYALNMQKIS